MIGRLATVCVPCGDSWSQGVALDRVWSDNGSRLVVGLDDGNRVVLPEADVVEGALVALPCGCTTPWGVKCTPHQQGQGVVYPIRPEPIGDDTAVAGGR